MNPLYTPLAWEASRLSRVFSVRWRASSPNNNNSNNNKKFNSQRRVSTILTAERLLQTNFLAPSSILNAYELAKFCIINIVWNGILIIN